MKRNIANLQAARHPDANIVVSGDLVQGEMTPGMAAMLESRKRMRALDDNATEADIEVAINPVRAAMGGLH